MSNIPNFRVWHEEKLWVLAKLDLWGDPDQTTCDLAPYLPKYSEKFNIPLAEVKLMQSTGLKDKNGVEVYEGDIVRVFDAKQINQLGQDGAYVDVYLDELDEVDFIIFKDGGFVLNRTGLDVSVCQSIEEFTVIGNIYENPELLEVEE